MLIFSNIIHGIKITLTKITEQILNKLIISKKSLFCEDSTITFAAFFYVFQIQ